MRIERLRLFIALAEVGSFYAAAQDVYLSQQGLSKAMAALEAELGVALFRRSHRGVTLTPAGRAALGYARAIVGKHDEMLDAILLAERAANPAERHVRAYLTHYAMSAVRCVDRDFLFSRVNASECSFRDMLGKIDDPGDADLLVCGAWPERKAGLLSRSDIEFLPLLSTQMGVMVSRQSMLAGQNAVHRRDVACLPLAAAANADVLAGYRWAFGDVALSALQIESDDERMLVDFARSVPEGAALIDSFSFRLLADSDPASVEGVEFVPLSTPRAEVSIGVIAKRGISGALPRRSIQRLAEWIAARYPEFTGRASS